MSLMIRLAIKQEWDVEQIQIKQKGADDYGKRKCKEIFRGAFNKQRITGEVHGSSEGL